MAGAAPPNPGFSEMLPQGLHVAVVTASKQVRITHASHDKGEWTTLPANPVEVSSAPTLVFFNGALFVFVTGTNNRIYYTVQAHAGVWGEWTAISDGESHDAPAAVVFHGKLFLFVRGTSGRFYLKTLSEKWSGWEEVPGDAVGQSSPAVAVVKGGTVLVLLVRGQNNNLYFTELHGDKWLGSYQEVPGGGQTNDTITAVPLHPSDDLLVVVRGTNSHVYALIRTPSGEWQAWAELPGNGAISSGPTLGLTDSGVSLYARGGDGALWHKQRTHAGGWGEYERIDAAGPLACAPATAQVAFSGASASRAAPAPFIPGLLAHGLNIAVVTKDNQVLVSHVSGEDKEWTPVPPAPVAIATPLTLISFLGNTYLFTVGVNKKIMFNVQTPTAGWIGWTTLPDGEYQDAVATVVYHNTLYLFARGFNQKLFYCTLTQTWGPWTEVPGDGITSSAPAVLVANDTLVLMIRHAKDDSPFYTLLTADGWTGRWYLVRGAGKTNDTPALILHKDTVVTIVRSLHNRVYWQACTLDLADWQPTWTENTNGFVVNARPALGLNGDTLHLYVRGSEGALYRSTRDAAGKWGDYVLLAKPGILAQAPSTVSV